MGYSSTILLLKIITAYWVILLVLQAKLVIGSKLATSQHVIAPHCTNKCGNISIPYPFGIEDGCYLKDHNNSFQIYCNQTSTGYIPTITLQGHYKLECLSISEMDSEIMCNVFAAYDCYNQSRRLKRWDGGLHLDAFTMSSSKNTMVGIGCDTYAWINGSRDGKSYSTGCSTQCSVLQDVQNTNGKCSFIGCCEAPIIKGLKNIIYAARSFYSHSSVYQFNPCSVAFPIAKDAFRFYPMNISLSRAALDKGVVVPLVLKWVIGQNNCSVAKADGSCLCKQNAECYDPEFEQGYRCKCSKGFSGNPYLPNGCSDFNECKKDNDCEKPEYCINTIGSYSCKCPKGFHGNGTKKDPCIHTSKGLPTAVWVAIGLSITFGSMLLVLVGWWLYSVIKRRQLMKQRARYFEKNGGLLLQQQMSSQEGIVERIKIFTIDELEKATDYFSKDRILGRGGYGTVYKGMLGEGRIVAVKKSNKVEESQFSDEFVNEVVILSQISHRNIVKLLGCCLETEVPLLVYEFIPNGTLFDHIHNPSEEFPITWKMRLQIASDSAAALSYLHSSSSTLIFHRDFKSSNILLDEKYRAKLSDFGTSRSVDIDQTHIVTRVIGTYGYMDPEYFQTQQLTEKSDVYSFGVVLVELLTGEKAVRVTTEEDKSLISWFLHHMENSRLFDIVDSQVLQEGSKEEILSIANLAIRCLKLDGKSRPTMKEVLLKIEALLALHIPKTTEQIIPLITKVTPQYYSIHNSESSSSRSAEVSLINNPR